MRDIGSTLLAKQKTRVYKLLIRLVLTNNGTTKTYYNEAGANRIKEVEHIEEGNIQYVIVTLDNSDKTVSALDLQEYKAVLSKGMTTSEGDEYSSHAPLYVMAQQSHSRGGLLEVTLSLAGIANLVNEDKASEEYTQEDDDSNTVKTLIRKIYGDSGVSILTCYDHCKLYDVVFDSEDALIDVFIPADSFRIGENETRGAKVKELLGWTKCALRYEDDGKPHIFVPIVTTSTAWVANTDYVVGDRVVPTVANEVEYKCTTAGKSHASTEPTWADALEVGDTITDGTVTWTVSYDYEYRAPSITHPTYHTFFSETYRKRVVIPGKVIVSSSLASEDSYTGSAQVDGYDDRPDELQIAIHRRLRVTSNAQCTALATAILFHYKLEAGRGSGLVPFNVGAEVHDFVKVKDSRLDEYRVGNIGFIRWHYKAGERPTMEFRFGRLGAGLAGIPPIGVAGAGVDLSAIWEYLEYLRELIMGLEFECYLRPYIFISPTALSVLTTGSMGIELFSSGSGTNLKIASTSSTGGTTIAAGQLASTPDDGTLLLQAYTAVKVDSGDKFILPVL